MATTVRISGVSDELYRTLQASAAREAMSLTEFLRRELWRLAKRSRMSEWLERTNQVEPIRSEIGAAQAIRALRDSVNSGVD